MKHKPFIPLLLMVTFTTIFLPVNGYSFINNNGIGEGYDEGSDGRESSSKSIEAYVTEGAYYYLGANADIQRLLQMIEFQDTRGIDYPAMQKIVTSAVDNMLKAEKTYEKLIQKAESTPYKQDVILKLRDFDYEEFIQEHGLNRVVFAVVREKLQSGDITGILKHTYNDFLKITDLLQEINRSVSNNQLPGLSLSWELNETLANSSLIGSYTARIFSEIL